MRKFSKIMAMAVVFLIPAFVFAQLTDSTSSIPVSTPALPAWAATAGSIGLGVYEVVVRKIPTVKNWSILSWIIKLIQVAVPNNKAGGGTH